MYMQIRFFFCWKKDPTHLYISIELEDVLFISSYSPSLHLLQSRLVLFFVFIFLCFTFVWICFYLPLICCWHTWNVPTQEQ